MKNSLRVSFQRNSVNGSFFIRLFEKHVKFNPYSFTKKYKTYPWDAKKHLKIISTDNSEDNLIIDDKKGSMFFSGITGTKAPHRSIVITQESSLFSPSNGDIELIINMEGFVATYFYNDEYVVVQSEVFENNLKTLDIPKEILETIKRTPYKLGVFNAKEFDVKFNPGRLELIGHTWLVAAWKMWFGEPFFELVPKERILSFPHATEIKELPGGQVYVQLYDKIEEPYTVENMFRQWKWQEWIDFDGLIKKYP